MTPIYMAQLSLKVQISHISTQKIDSCLVETYGIVIAAFQVFNKLGFS